ncbi:MAG TPA: phosphoglycerate mutase family protein [Acidimicrobiales bacterium]|nr:phosphoglycerate mutase family protein [Acidimicrobiales bacterium]
MRLILVRHAHAGRKDQWHRSDRLRPLDALGQRQAGRIEQVLAPMKPTRIVSSPYRRCLETMAPAAASFGLDIERSRALEPDAPAKALALIRQLSAPRSPSGVVLCTHGEILGAVLTQMAREDGVRLPRRPPGLKGCAWVLDVRRGKLVGARYLTPR